MWKISQNNNNNKKKQVENRTDCKSLCDCGPSLTSASTSLIYLLGHYGGSNESFENHHTFVVVADCLLILNNT